MIGQRRRDGKGNRTPAAAAAAAVAAAAESDVSTPSGNDNENASPGAAAAAAFYREGLCRLFFFFFSRFVAFSELETASLRKFMDNLELYHLLIVFSCY
jgi:hypothetical protein